MEQQCKCTILDRISPQEFSLRTVIEFEFGKINSFSISITGTGINSDPFCVESVSKSTNSLASGSARASTTFSTTISAMASHSGTLSISAATGAEPIDITPIGENLKRKNLKGMSFPKNKEGRSFQAHWYNTYDWIEYSSICDAVYCYPCRNFSVSKSTREEFVSFGFTNWGKALATKNGFPRHASSNGHISAVASWSARMHADRSGISINIQLSEKVLEQRRYYTQAVIDVICFLCKNELALRGSWDQIAESETGLFNSLFDFTLTRDAKLRESEKAMPPNVTYKSPQIQNELIGLLADSLCAQIVEEVNKAPFLTLMVDGTKDKNGREIISIAVRYVHEEKAKETLLGFENCLDLDAKAIATLVLNSLRSYGVDDSKIISQCYDGASVMNGMDGGVQKIVQNMLGRSIPYVHCFNHRLHLVLINSIDFNAFAKDFFDQTRLLHNFFSRFKVKKLYEGSPISRLIDTRWSGHLKTTISISKNYQELVKTLSLFQRMDKKESGLDAEDLALAAGILKAITTHKFVFMLLVMKDILQILEPVDKQLQARATGYREALPLIYTVLDLIEQKRTDEEFESFFNQSLAMLPTAVGDSRPIRQRNRSSNLNDFVVMDSIGERNEISDGKSLLKASYFEIIDLISREMQRRFNDNNEVLLSLSSANDFDLQTLKALEGCGITLPPTAEMTVAKAYVEKNRKEDDSILSTILPIKAAVPLVYDLFRAVDTFGCSTAVCEASFSAVSRVGIVGRMSMTNQRLRQLSFLAFENRFLVGIQPGEVLRKFNQSKNRRVQLF